MQTTSSSRGVVLMRSPCWDKWLRYITFRFVSKWVTHHFQNTTVSLYFHAWLTESRLKPEYIYHWWPQVWFLIYQRLILNSEFSAKVFVTSISHNVVKYSKGICQSARLVAKQISFQVSSSRNGCHHKNILIIVFF